MKKLLSVIALAIVLAPAAAMAQEFGDTSLIMSWVEFLTHDVAIAIVAVALLGAIIYGIYKQDIAAGGTAVLAVIAIGALFGFVVTIATRVVGA